ncbi:MAG: 16S rRNA (uracil(1498)-N(3))-methyltransferase [Gammaproteobacteria bacterium]|nr:MAG: 16S rRNA (uracil(1498)-N(3))-methyltransferase [Gammaproteobacteria bacterium]
MRIPRLYCPELDLAATTMALPDSAIRHAVQVLRLKVGSSVRLFDGKGNECEAQLEVIARRNAEVILGKRIESTNESPLEITLLQGISRGERMDYALQKAVELGVTRIIPVETERCNVQLSGDRKAKRWSHWQGVMISACEQCGRNLLPDLSKVVGLEDALQQREISVGLVLDPLAGKGLMEINKNEKFTLLIGPEGGLTEDELTKTEAAGFERVRFGPRTLRTETASVAVLAIIQALWGDLG